MSEDHEKLELFERRIPSATWNQRQILSNISLNCLNFKIFRLLSVQKFATINKHVFGYADTYQNRRFIVRKIRLFLSSPGVEEKR